MEVGLIPIRLSKVTSNDRQEMIYLPKLVVRRLGLYKGTPVAIYLDQNRKCLIIKPVELENP